MVVASTCKSACNAALCARVSWEWLDSVEKHLGLLDAILKTQDAANLGERDLKQELNSTAVDAAWYEASHCLQRLADEHPSNKKPDAGERELEALELLQRLQSRLQPTVPKAAGSEQRRDEL
jgi:hypothetical protein